MTIKLLTRQISAKKYPLIIGEVSANHNNSLKKIFKIIDCAAEIGLEAIKFQTYDLNQMTLNSKKKQFLLKKNFSNNKWNNRSLYSLYKEAHLPFEWHRDIFNRAKKKGLICFSSVFDERSLNLLKGINCPAYKIASLESMHFPLIKKVIEENKLIIVSTGTLDIKEIDELIKFLKKNNAKFIIMHCVTQYPAANDNCNLSMISYLRKKYKCNIGFSDHTKDSLAALTAVGLGANIIEKHFMLNDNEKTLDSEFSFGPKKMEKLIMDSKLVWQSIGEIKNKISPAEKFYKKFSRSIYACKDILKNEKISKKNVRVIRPGFGIEPKFYNQILGKKVKQNIKFGEPILFNKLN